MLTGIVLLTFYTANNALDLSIKVIWLMLCQCLHSKHTIPDIWHYLVKMMMTQLRQLVAWPLQAVSFNLVFCWLFVMFLATKPISCFLLFLWTDLDEYIIVKIQSRLSASNSRPQIKVATRACEDHEEEFTFSLSRGVQKGVVVWRESLYRGGHSIIKLVLKYT